MTGSPAATSAEDVNAMASLPKNVNTEIASAVKQVNDELSLRWVFLFLSADKKKSYCLYEAPNADAIREAAKRLNIPADTIIELSGEVRPEMFA